MEREFDKEIDALLRKAAKSGAATAPVLDSHLDADEISMFAEDALPDAARPRVISHMADCDLCRAILSNLVVLNAEDESTAAAAAPVAEPVAVETESTSWFSGLFSTRNLAFGFGALALVFAGFLGFAVVQNLNSTGADLARADRNEMEAPAARKTSNSAVSSNTNAASSDAEIEPEGEADDRKGADSDVPVALDKDVVTGKDIAVQRNTPVTDGVSGRRDVVRSMSTPDDPKPGVVAEATEELADKAVADAQAPPQPVVSASQPGRSVITPRGGVTKPKATPAQTERSADRKRKEEGEGRDAAANKMLAKEDKSSSGRKIGGKTFTRRNGIWYDSAYRNQPTKNIKRGTSEFQSLDAGVRSIANQLSGTVVVVWKSKALKIQ